MKKVIIILISLVSIGLSAQHKPNLNVTGGIDLSQRISADTIQIGDYYLVWDEDSMWIESPLGTWFCRITTLKDLIGAHFIDVSDGSSNFQVSIDEDEGYFDFSIDDGENNYTSISASHEDIQFYTTSDGVATPTGIDIHGVDAANSHINFSIKSTELLTIENDGADFGQGIKLSTIEDDARTEAGVLRYVTSTGVFQGYDGVASEWDEFQINDGIEPYTIFVQGDNSDPDDAATVYFCSTPQAPATNEANRRVGVIKAGTILYADITMNTTAGNAGSNENISIYVRLNDSDDYLIETIGSTDNIRIFNNYSLNIPVVQGDKILIKVVYPTWDTNPTNVHWSGNLFIN
ncbi:MAG: hypothetical protein PHW73_00445 [Atribacterota bacterium]|nr:hypothetical protein [Atribacterota bacterium]